MATQASLAIRRANAVERMQASADILAKRLGVPVPDLKPMHRDVDVQRALELEAVAGLLEDVVSSLPAPVSPATTASKKATESK